MGFGTGAEDVVRGSTGDVGRVTVLSCGSMLGTTGMGMVGGGVVCGCIGGGGVGIVGVTGDA